MADPFNLSRFVEAQAPVMGRVRSELQAGRKQSHWMWFVFPQVAGLGHSAMAERYAISSLAEAKAFLAHEVLGPRLAECTNLVLALHGLSALAVFGRPDDVKFRSSMTLFAAAEPGGGSYQAAIDKYFSGEPDGETLRRLGST